AAPAAIVEGLQMPAWLEHEGAKQPLVPGANLSATDTLYTGANGRILLRLEEGSRVKLGENAQLELANLVPPDEEQGIFQGTLNVLKGALRFTTSPAHQVRKRQITVQIAGITCGIRGTDFWGKAEPDRDFVVLIEGSLQIRPEDQLELTLDESLQTYVLPKDQSALPLTRTNPKQLQDYAAETELHAGHGVQTAEGKWTVHVASFRNPENAAAARQQFEIAGYAVQEQLITVNDIPWTRLSVTGFASKIDAGAFARQIATQFETLKPRVLRSVQ
ncbi:MAG: FecR domain-containing protein, partial [Burkholderiales bacterium]